MIPKSRLTSMRYRLRDASPGPWKTDMKVDPKLCAVPVDTAGDGRLGYSNWKGAILCSSCDDDRPRGDLAAQANADFIAHAWQDMADLLDEVERLRGLKETESCMYTTEEHYVAALKQASNEIITLKEVIRLLAK